MSIQNKPLFSEAVVFFDAKGQVCRQMRVPEFEAMLDGIVQFAEYQNQQMRCAYVLIDSRLLVRSAVLFLLNFLGNGAGDPLWNLPLRQLADKASRGPDLGAGPIRLACAEQSPIESVKSQLWSAQAKELATLRDTLKRNSLGFLVDDGIVSSEHLQMVPEERWYSAPVTAPNTVMPARALDAKQRKKAAELIKVQRKRIAQLHLSYQQALDEQRDLYEQELLDVRAAHQVLLQKNAKLESSLSRIEQQLETQTEESERLAQRLQDIKAQSNQQIAELKKALEAYQDAATVGAAN